MTPTELRAALSRLGLSQSQAARDCGVNPRTMRRWIAGRARVPAAVTMLIAAWLARNQEEPR